MVDKEGIRSKVISEVERLLIGPRQGEDEFVEGRITLAYLAGILFPRGEKRSDLAVESSMNPEGECEELSSAGQSQEFSGDSDNPLSMANDELPSSVGISFVLHSNSSFMVEVDAASYLESKNAAGQKGFRRHPIGKQIVSSGDLFSSGIVSVLDGKAELLVVERPSSFRDNCRVVTVSLVNSETVKGSQNKKVNLNNRLYQVSLRCVADEAGIEPYDAYHDNSSDMEESILQLQYKDSPTYAVGHGCSVDWEEPSCSGAVKSVEISYTPHQSVYRPVFDRLMIGLERSFENLNVFNIRRLAMAEEGDRGEICEELLDFVVFYEAWITQQEELPSDGYESAAGTLLGEMKECSRRMREGVEILKSRPECWRAFTLANLAMLLQIEQTSRLRVDRSKREREGECWPIGWAEKNETFNTELSDFPDGFLPAWRPFQLAFFLTTFLGLEDTSSQDHSIVDLIWFSTGGGKTEAYLLLSSYELIRRRVRYDTPELGYGTAIITRYTLRFLTADQFSRTASLGCALEKVRLLNPELLGNEPFRIGLYMGSSQSYPKYSDASTALQELMGAPSSEHKFQIEECPSCGTGLIPEELSYDEEGRPEGFGIKLVSGGKVEYICPNDGCIFSGTLKIPVTVIDEDIYNNPPSFLLGTIDKFAMVPWRELAGQVFGKRRNKVAVVPPTLIIQDELHLISGPLGTIAAIYEAGFDCIIKEYQGRLGLPQVGAKYVASSATVRDSQRQIERLTGRPSAIFPPRGIRADDSCFAREEKNEATARLYVGVMAQGVRAASAAHWVSAAILQSVRSVAKSIGSKEDCDFLWTLLCYCNSKRELGLINGAVSQEIYERMRVYAATQGQDPSDVDPLSKEEVSAEGVRSISETRGNLLVGVSDADSSFVKDVVPCTNMISVGIDIDRLGVMMVNGQPKTTAEYIQASSRVGRSPIAQGPGLVVTLYSPSKPRDRSHYEHFKSYHKALYRLVEPTSVTPGSEQALSKACHAAVVTVVRHAVDGMATNAAAANLNLSDQSTSRVLDAFKERLLSAYPLSDSFERARIEESINGFIKNWEIWTQFNIEYASRAASDNCLLRKHGVPNKTNIGVPTMMSMRGVDVEVEVRK